jgi:hypothetical protein
MFTVRQVSVVFAVIGLGLLLGCGDARVRDVENSVDFAKRMLERTKTDPVAILSFSSSAELGGNVITYITANLADPAGFAPYVWMGPPAPYSVVIRPGDAPGEYVVEGYTAKTNNPFKTETIEDVGRKQTN